MIKGCNHLKKKRLNIYHILWVLEVHTTKNHLRPSWHLAFWPRGIDMGILVNKYEWSLSFLMFYIRSDFLHKKRIHPFWLSISVCQKNKNNLFKDKAKMVGAPGRIFFNLGFSNFEIHCLFLSDCLKHIKSTLEEKHSLASSATDGDNYHNTNKV